MLRRQLSSPLRRLSGLAGVDGLNSAEDFLSVAKAAVERTDALVSGIDQVPPGEAVVEVLDAISDSVCGVADVANFCYCNHPSEAWRTQSAKALQHLVQYISALNTNDRLYSALQSSLSSRERPQEWTAEASVVGESLLRDFVSCGMGNEKRSEIQQYIASEHVLEMRFQKTASEHNEIHALSLRDSTLLPLYLQQRCTQHSGAVHLPMTPSHYLEVIHSVEDESIRKSAYMAHFQSLKANIGTLNELLKARRQWAHALNWKSFAHFKLADSIAAHPEAVTDFIRATATAVKDGADEEIEVLKEMKGSPVYPWDVSHYTNMKKQQIMRGYGAQLTAEFDVQSVINGIGLLLSECMDIEMTQSESDAVWESTVQCFAFKHGSGSLIGHLFLDLMARKHKRPENAHYTLRCGRQLKNGDYQIPIVALVTNFASKNLSFHDLRTLMHEFGHVLHSLLSKTRFQHLFGTRGPLDLVEIPSHFFENLVYSPQALQYLAGATARATTAASLQKLIEVHGMFRHLRMQEQLQIALADQIFHGEDYEGRHLSTTDVMEQVSSEIGSIPFIPNTFKEAWLTHLTTYGARYYSYIFSRRIGNLAWEACIGEDLFNKDKWQSIREQLFQPGGAINPQQYVFNLIGKERLIQHKQGWTPLS